MYPELNDPTMDNNLKNANYQTAYECDICQTLSPISIQHIILEIKYPMINLKLQHIKTLEMYGIKTRNKHIHTCILTTYLFLIILLTKPIQSLSTSNILHHRITDLANQQYSCSHSQHCTGKQWLTSACKSSPALYNPFQIPYLS